MGHKCWAGNVAQSTFAIDSTSMSVSESFTPLHACLGGAILGIAASGKVLLTGKVLGISGILGGVLKLEKPAWRYIFLGSLAAASIPAALLLPNSFSSLPTAFSYARAIAGGLMVGVGVKMGNGCTSGHGVCGNARLSIRSLVYTCTFMAAGALSTTLASTASLLGAKSGDPLPFLGLDEKYLTVSLGVGGFALLAFTALGLLGSTSEQDGKKSTKAGLRAILSGVTSAIAGASTAVALTVSGMTLPSKVASFLSPLLGRRWDPSLMFVMAPAIGVSILAFQGISGGLRLLPKSRVKGKGGKPILNDEYHVPSNTVIDKRLVLGGALFGAGWGLTGLCPGPALVSYLGLAASTFVKGGGIGVLVLDLLSSKLALFNFAMAAGIYSQN